MGAFIFLWFAKFLNNLSPQNLLFILFNLLNFSRKIKSHWWFDFSLKNTEKKNSCKKHETLAETHLGVCGFCARGCFSESSSKLFVVLKTQEGRKMMPHPHRSEAIVAYHPYCLQMFLHLAISAPKYIYTLINLRIWKLRTISKNFYDGSVHHSPCALYR